MLVGWSPLQNSEDPSQPVAYLFDNVVLKKVGNVHMGERRAIAPELLTGNMAAFSRAVQALRFKMKYRVATLSFHADDIDVTAFNSGDITLRANIAAATELFLELAFAGVPPEHRPPVLVGTHTHTGRLEVNIAMPRYILTAGGNVRSYNPHPVTDGSRNSWDAYCDLACTFFDWKNPRHFNSRISIKGPHWVEKELAAAKRNSVEINKDQRVLYIVQEAKRMAMPSALVAKEEFRNSLEELALELKFKCDWRVDGRLEFRDVTGGRPITLRGHLLKRTEEQNSIPQQPSWELRDLFLDRWRRRADYNNVKFGHGRWDGSEPDCYAIAVNPSLTISHRHPDYCGDGPQPLPSRPFTTGFTTALQSLLKNLIGRIAAATLQTVITQATVDAARQLRKYMERTENAARTTSNGNPKPADAGPMRPVTTSSGTTERRGARGDAEGSLERAEQHPETHGTADRSGRSNLAGHEADRGTAHDSDGAIGRPAEHTYRYELAAPRHGAAVPTRLNMIAGMRQSLPDLQGIAACAADGSTYFVFQDCELRYWPDGHIEVEGSVDAETANRLAGAVAAVLQSELATMELQVEDSPDDEPQAFDPF